MAWIQPVVEFKFWFSDKRGLIRERGVEGRTYFPEVWCDGRWHKGSPYVMDAITGMGEDGHSCGECAQPLDEQIAAQYAAEQQIDLHVNNRKDPHPVREWKWQTPRWVAALRARTAKKDGCV